MNWSVVRSLPRYVGAAVAVALFLCGGPAQAVTWYVAPGGNDSPNTGTNGWGDAFATISNAVERAVSNDTVLVSNGTYTITSQINVTNAITLEGVGGYSNTTVSCAWPASTNRCFFINHSLALVVGFTITNGHTTTADRWGGNLYLTAGTVRDCVVVKGVSYDYGGNIYMTGGMLNSCTVADGRVDSPGGGWTYGGGVFITAGTITNCALIRNGFINNYHTFGGAIRMTGGLVANTTVSSNFISSFRRKQGGGIWMNAGTVRNCRIESNYTLGGSDGSDDGLKGGGGVWMEGGTLRNCLVRGNDANDNGNDRGGGIRLENGIVQNCTVVRNRSASTGGGLSLTAGSVTNSIVYFNSGSSSSNITSSSGVGYSCAPELSGGEANLMADPVFVSGGGGYGTNAAGGDFHLQFASPCVDAGTNLVAVSNDLDDVSRPRDGNGDSLAIDDMGCFEAAPTPGDLVCSFTANTNAGLAPLTVVFTASAAGNTNGLVYYWDFGNATDSGSGKRVVTNSYNPIAGAYYTVTLAVTNDVLVGASSTRPSYIKAFVDADVYVSPSGSAAPPFQSWTTAAADIQSAINIVESDLLALRPATAVVVTNGNYTLTLPLDVRKGYTVRSVNGCSNTFVNAGGIAGQRVLNVSHASAVVDGFSLTNGNALNNGSGVNMTAGRIKNCIIGWNRVSDDGGGWVYGAGVRMSGGTISNCVIRNNVFVGTVNAFGGGIYMTGGTVDGCTLMSNSVKGVTSEQGAGIYMSAGVVQNCTLTGNSLPTASSLADNGSGRYGGGGGICAGGGTIRNCLVAGNQVASTDATAGRGGGIRLAAGTVDSCTIVRNQAGASCGGLGVTSGTASNTIIYFNSAVQTNDVGGANVAVYSCAPELTNGLGNLTSDPQFKLPGSGSGTNAVLGNYRFRYDSPCINAGANQSWMTGASDLEGNPRIVKSLVDMGAYESVMQRGTVFVIH